MTVDDTDGDDDGTVLVDAVGIAVGTLVSIAVGVAVDIIVGNADRSDVEPLLG